jgi:hypothetical protein
MESNILKMSHALNSVQLYTTTTRDYSLIHTTLRDSTLLYATPRYSTLPYATSRYSTHNVIFLRHSLKIVLMCIGPDIEHALSRICKYSIHFL